MRTLTSSSISRIRGSGLTLRSAWATANTQQVRSFRGCDRPPQPKGTIPFMPGISGAINLCYSVAGWKPSQPQDLLHAVKPWRLVLEPERGAHRALCIDRAVGGAVHQFEALAGAGEDHMVIADRIAAAQCREADRPGAARPGDPVPAA